MQKKQMKQNVFALLAAMIWGTAFVAQSVSTEYLESWTFNAARSLIGFLALLVLCIGLRIYRKRRGLQPQRDEAAYFKQVLLGGLCSGSAMAIGSYFQQKGLETTGSGKAGFITALYIVIVPILGIFLKRKATWMVWISVALATAGLYCLCIQEGFSVTTGDIYLLFGALGFACQILLIDRFTDRVDGIELSCMQLFTVMVLSTIGMFLFRETPSLYAVRQCIWPLLYVGVMSSGVAYTLQIIAQKDSNPTVISLLLSMESVFATLAGALLLRERMSGREYLGCLLMLCAVILAQLPAPQRRRTEKTEV